MKTILAATVTFYEVVPELNHAYITYTDRTIERVSTDMGMKALHLLEKQTHKVAKMDINAFDPKICYKSIGLFWGD